MIAALPMHDRPETRAAHDALWALIRDRLARRCPELPIPAELSRPTDLAAHWRDPGLLLSQACGMPYRQGLHRHLRLVGTPDHRLPGCPPGYYCSIVVMRPGETRPPEDWPRLRLAYNEAGSQSGWAAAQMHMATLGLPGFARALATGSHRASVAAVEDGRADLAFIDAQSWRAIRRWDAPSAAEVARTDPSPGLPFVTGLDNPDPLAEAVRDAIAALPPAHRDTLDLHGFVAIPTEAYLAIPTPAPPA